VNYVTQTLFWAMNPNENGHPTPGQTGGGGMLLLLQPKTHPYLEARFLKKFGFGLGGVAKTCSVLGGYFLRFRFHTQQKNKLMNRAPEELHGFSRVSPSFKMSLTMYRHREIGTITATHLACSAVQACRASVHFFGSLWSGFCAFGGDGWQGVLEHSFGSLLCGFCAFGGNGWQGVLEHSFGSLLSSF
jgi:hypothetical protein